MSFPRAGLDHGGPRKARREGIAGALRGEEAQGSGRSFRRQAETEQRGLCADDGELLMTLKVKE